jgi:hypothetical protein
MVFCLVQKFFSDNTRVRIFIFFVARSANFFLQNLTLGYMTKNLNQIICFFLHQNQNIFFSNIGNQNIFLEKNHNPPLQVKWSFPYRPYGLISAHLNLNITTIHVIFEFFSIAFCYFLES